ncbi:MAG: hypothetical protein IT236_14715 [Bacteroidia bacterium]|nr:hypothetical protein [Bacteroidia bacterium]
MKKLKNTCFCLLILLCCKCKVNAQDSTKHNFFWVQAGILSTKSIDAEIGFKTSVFYSRKHHVVGIDYYQGDEFNISLFKQRKTNSITQIKNIGLIYGRSFDWTYLRITPMLGPTFGKLTWRNDEVDVEKTSSGSSFFSFTSYKYTYHYNKFSYLGFYTNLNLMIMAGKHFAIGADFYKNWHQHSDDGFVIHLVFGNIRRDL